MENIKDDDKPILVQFESGALHPTLRSNIDFKFLRSTKLNKRMGQVECGKLIFNGPVTQRQHGPVRYYLGLVDKETSKIEEVQNLQMCTLKPKLKEEVLKKKITNDLTYRQKNDTLVEAFGSSKQKRSVSSRIRNEKAGESVDEKIAGAAKKALLDPSRPTWTPSPKEETNTDIIPLKNMEARTPSAVYKVSDVISVEDYQLLKVHAKDMIFFEESTLLGWSKENKYPMYIIRLLSQISPLPKSSAERVRKGAYICYLNYLIQFDKVPPKDLRTPNRDKCPGVPEPLKPGILEKFSVAASENGKSRCRTPKLKDKLTCYILVLALIIENYDMDCRLLVKDLKIGIARVTKLLRATGCTVSARNPGKTENMLEQQHMLRATLKAPNEGEKL